MSQESNGRGPSKALTHVQFFQACEEMRSQREGLLRERPSQVETARRLGEKLGFGISKDTIPDICKATGILWRTRAGTREGEGTAKSARGNAIRTLTVCLYRLHKSLGEQVPPMLQSLYEAIEQLDTSH